MVSTDRQQPRRGLHRLLYVYGWRFRHWWYDTESGAVARRVTALVLALGGLVLLVDHFRSPFPQGQPQQAFVWWVQLIIMVVSMLISALLSRTNQTKPEVQTPEIPTTEEGTAVKRIYGTVRISEPQVLAWRSAGTDKIRKGGGKK